MNDTIYATATAYGRAAISVVRISGPATRFVIETMTGSLPEPRRAVLRSIRSPDGELIDRGLVFWFIGPSSFTGEDAAEIHLHGATTVSAAILRALAACDGTRMAEPGEFTRRALMNGRMDLSEAEGLADLIDSETDAQRRQALTQLSGTLGRQTDQWRDDLIAVMALFEASLDFSDEGDVDETVIDEAGSALSALRETMVRALDASGRGERLRDGLTILLAGPPNAGKSTLLNAIAQRDIAIVSPIAGTTRDIIEARLDLDGLPVILLDSAGLRDSTDAIEVEGMRRTIGRAQNADLILWLCPQGDGEMTCPSSLVSQGVEIWPLVTKLDQAIGWTGDDIAVSALTGEGLDGFVDRLSQWARDRLTMRSDDIVLTRARHKEAISDAVEAIDRALACLHEGAIELIAEDVRIAARAVGRITGHIGVEDVLDRLFSSFCIGK